MNLRLTHQGYAYQDLVTGIALVDLMLGTAVRVTVDTKGFPGDRFDDLSITYISGSRVRIQIKHTTQDRELVKATFSADGRNLKLKSHHARQADVAAIVGVSQAWVSKLEAGDLSHTELGTLQSYVAALGGSLRVVAEFNDSSVELAA